MTGIGTLVNVCAIILGGFLGLLFKGGLKQHYQDAVLRCLGLCTLFIGAAGGLSGLLSVSGTRRARRWESIKVRWQNEKFQERLKTFTGWTAQIIQHEIDHCSGILI